MKTKSYKWVALARSHKALISCKTFDQLKVARQYARLACKMQDSLEACVSARNGIGATYQTCTIRLRDV